MVVIESLPEDYLEMVEVPFLKDPEFGVHTVPFTRTVYIDQSDFQEAASKDSSRLALGKSVGLRRVPFPITATSFEKDPVTGVVTLIKARYNKPAEGIRSKKAKAYIHWIAEWPSLNSPVKASARTYEPLFTCDKTDSHPDGFLSVANPYSEQVFSKALVETGHHESIHRAPWPDSKGEAGIEPDSRSIAAAAPLETVRFQGMRVGYFCLNRDSSPDKIVLNRIVTLKEDSRKWPKLKFPIVRFLMIAHASASATSQLTAVVCWATSPLS
ncbi:ribosomal protein L25/Gln-tRNA synthetase [Aspergillus undulatus]|uniref:ribosomal protein L25/Gln-tRNA synthetase n=1 Tax=Aspergillus undulatus TaxID=1810928 RepID=UPI003CCE37D9